MGYNGGVLGQSLGKIILKIKVVKIDGKPANFMAVLIESLTKPFPILVLIDFILGAVLFPEKRQRFLNYLSNTIVVRV